MLYQNLESYVNGTDSTTSQRNLLRSIKEVEPEQLCHAMSSIKGVDGNTALHYAGLRNDETTCDNILNKLNPTYLASALMLQNDNGQTVLAVAAANRHYSLLKFLLKHVGKDDWLKVLRIPDNDFKFQEILDDQMSEEKIFPLLKRNGKDGKTPLHVAAEEGCQALIGLIKDALTKKSFVVLVFTQDNYGYTPIDVAAINGHDRTIKLLLQDLAVGDMHYLMKFPDPEGKPSLLQVALSSCCISLKFVLKSLDSMERFEILHLEGAPSESILHELLKSQSPLQPTTQVLNIIGKCLTTDQMFQLLKKTDSDGQTPLHYAALRGKEDALFQLLHLLSKNQQQFVLQMESTNHMKASDLARENGHKDLADSIER